MISRPAIRASLAALACSFLALLTGPVAADPKPVPVAFPFKPGDRVAWIGSSSTRIGVWPKTMEFLLRTRHPELQLMFERFTTGGGTFATGLQNLDKWLEPYRPMVVFFNYGGNDAGAGEKGLPAFRENIERCVARLPGTRVLFMTPQAADVRKSGAEPAARRKLYADELIRFGQEKGWPVIDVHSPLEVLQASAQKDDEAYTILKDKIHLTDPAYIGWGYYLYERLNPPTPISKAGLTAAGKVTAQTRCRIENVEATAGGLSFTRADEILPILPPVSLPPRQYVPLERFSSYLLQITDLPAGDYAITCEGKPIGVAGSAALAEGVNLNSLVLDGGHAAPWAEMAQEIWEGKGLDQVGKTRWRFEVRRK